jgi:alpha-mannosidase
MFRTKHQLKTLGTRSSRTGRILVLMFLTALAAPRAAVTARPRTQPSQQSEPAPAPGSPKSSAPTFWLIPHTHWEGAVFKTREEYLEEGLPHILQALNLLRTYPDYRFVLDQVAYVKPFLERYPEEADDFHRFVSEGRLAIVGGNDVMLDVNIPGGESWIRQVLYGKGYYQRELAVDVRTGWGLDTFGHHAQMPQLLKLAGYDSYWFQRGVPERQAASEFLWQGLDGTKIPAFWLPFGYGLFYPVPKNLLEFDGYTRARWDALGRYSSFSDRLALAGADVISPEAELPEMVKVFNAQAGAPFVLRFGVPSDFERVVAGRSDHPVFSGELNPVFQGVYSNRIELKQWMREDERILTTAEKLEALAQWLGSPQQNEQRWQAWEPVLFNQAHDLTSGTMVDKVYLDTIRGYQFSRELGEQMVLGSLDSIAAKIDTHSSDSAAIPIVVFNSLGSPRTDVVETQVGFSKSSVATIELIGPSGQPEALQSIDEQRYATGGLRRATIAFIARDVPALGWAVYRASPLFHSAPEAIGPNNASRQSGSVRAASTMLEDSGSIENQFYRATFDLWTGAMTGLELKSSEGDWQGLGNRPANIVAREQDGGDFWELYGNLNGGRLTAMTRKQGLPEPGASHLSNEWVGGSGQTIPGPVFSEFHIDHPFGDGRFSTRVRVYNGIPRIDVETKVLNNDKFVRYRLLIPTSIQNGRRFDEIPFGAIERPQSQEFPAQNWIDYGDGRHGLALLNIGLPGSNVADGTLLLSLMRSARINAYSYSGGYEPGISSDLGLELGEERTFHYALVPHVGTWQQAGVFRAGLEFNYPLIARPLSQHSGTLPDKFSFLDVMPADVVVSALMPAEDSQGVIVRVYEAAGQPVSGARIHFASGVLSATEVNLMEQPVATLAPTDNSIAFDLRPFEIKTFRVKLRPWQPH